MHNVEEKTTAATKKNTKGTTGVKMEVGSITIV
jgi:hypothetical protein